MVFIFNFGKVINAMLLAEKETIGFEFKKKNHLLNYIGHLLNLIVFTPPQLIFTISQQKFDIFTNLFDNQITP